MLCEHIWMDDMLVAVVEQEGSQYGTVYAIRTDHMGRPVFATDATGTKVWEVQYLPFGGVQTVVGAPIDLGFPGQWFQTETGLYQNWMRDYDPTTGSYLQPDPLGLVDGPNVYRYALGNPMRYVDFSGLSATTRSINPSSPPDPEQLYCVSDEDDPCREWFEALSQLLDEIIDRGGHFIEIEEWNRAAENYNEHCVPLGYQPLNPIPLPDPNSPAVRDLIPPVPPFILPKFPRPKTPGGGGIPLGPRPLIPLLMNMN